MTDQEFTKIAIDAVYNELKQAYQAQEMRIIPNENVMYSLHMASLRLQQLHHNLQRRKCLPLEFYSKSPLPNPYE